MTLDALRQALAARKLVATTIVAGPDGWRVSGRGNSDGWTTGRGATIEAAVEDMLRSTWARTDLPKIRYFRRAAGDLMATYDGQPPLRSEGPVEELTPAQYRAAREAMERDAAPPVDDFDDLGDLL